MFKVNDIIKDKDARRRGRKLTIEEVGPDEYVAKVLSGPSSDPSRGVGDTTVIRKGRESRYKVVGESVTIFSLDTSTLLAPPIVTNTLNNCACDEVESDEDQSEGLNTLKAIEGLEDLLNEHDFYFVPDNGKVIYEDLLDAGAFDGRPYNEEDYIEMVVQYLRNNI